MKFPKKKISHRADKLLIDLRLGPEPVFGGEYDNTDLIRAYNWFQIKYSVEDMKGFLLTYLKQVKFPKDDLEALKRVPASVDFRTVGANARILMTGGKLPEDVASRFGQHVHALVDIGRTMMDTPSVGPSVQKSLKEKISNLKARIEEELDVFSLEGNSSFDVKDWISKNDIKPLVAKQIAAKFKPVYAEMYEASLGKDPELKEAYHHFKKLALKKYLEFFKGIIAALDGIVVNATKAPRKVRAKKVKPAAELVAKLKYASEDVSLNIASINPQSIIGADQLWVYNTKTRMLGSYKAMSASGLTVKGSTLIGFDETVSIAKKLRKPEVILPELRGAGKVALRSLMDKIKSKPKVLNGRINKDTLLVRFS